MKKEFVSGLAACGVFALVMIGLHNPPAMSDTDIDGALIRPATMPGNRLTGNAAIARTQLAQMPNVERAVMPFDWRVWDSGAHLTTAGTDDLGIVAGTFATDVYTVQAGDLKAAGATTRRALVQLRLPETYDDGQTVTVRLRAGMATTVADTSCTIDAEAYEVGLAGLVGGGDLVTTAADDMNSLTPAYFTFTITSDSLVAGDVIELRVSITCNDAMTGTAVTPIIYRAALIYDSRG